MKTVEILIVEDNRGDVVLVQEAMTRAAITHHLTVARDGVEAMDFLRRQGKHASAPRPDLIVLDLKLPRRSGREVLADLAPDPSLRDIPVVILSSSISELEIARAHMLPTQMCMGKPSTFVGYVELVQCIERFRLQGHGGTPGGVP
jgi:two-component system, chemotaxis family, response regulator Rcp1